MRHRSKKKEAEYRLRRPLVERLLAERPYCEACPVFAKYDEKVTYVRKPSVDIHEIVRRSQGGSILEESNLMAVCRDCHRRIGNHPQLAFDLGLAKHGWTLNQETGDDSDRG
jgi:5-methylcytosine-specific restriction endonuclease McrA